MGYHTLYILHRILRDVKPKRILELGLGESTKILTQYAMDNPDIEHYVVEHDQNWIDFFCKNYSPAKNTEIVTLPWGFKDFKEAESVRIYDGFEERFANGKYDLILVDAPLGGDMTMYSRIDTLSLLPNNLAESFVIIFDDYQRTAEKNTVKEMLTLLPQYKQGNYRGETDVSIICSLDLKFLATL